MTWRMSQHPADSMQQRAGKAIVAHAIFRVESALTISLTILLAFFLPRPFPWWRWWYWMVLGGVTEALIIYTSLMDERTAQRVVADMLRVRYNPGEIVTPAYRKKVEQALRYRDQLQRIVTTAQPGVLRDHLQNTVTGIAEWMDHIFAVATVVLTRQTTRAAMMSSKTVRVSAIVHHARPGRRLISETASRLPPPWVSQAALVRELLG